MNNESELLRQCAASGQMDSRQVAAHVEAGEMERGCTCHPDDNPPKPCARKYAYSECIAATPLPTYHQQEKP